MVQSSASVQWFRKDPTEIEHPIIQRVRIDDALQQSDPSYNRSHEMQKYRTENRKRDNSNVANQLSLFVRLASRDCKSACNTINDG